MYMDPPQNTNNNNTTLLRSQLFVPPLQYGILAQTLDETTKTVEGVVCIDTPGWRSSSGKSCSNYSIEGSNCSDMGQDGTTAKDSCKVACNSCPAHIKLVQEDGGTFDRLPSPIEESHEPNYSSLLTDDNWKMGESTDIGQNTEIPDMLDDIEEKIDELRKNIPKPYCTCGDIKSNFFGPSRCAGADLSEDFVWDDKFNYQAESSIDSDDRYKVKCRSGYDYKENVESLKDKTLVYNCTSQTWETKGDRDDPFTTYTFPDGMIHCEDSSPSEPQYQTCTEILDKVYNRETGSCYRCTNFDDGDRCQVDEDYVIAPGFQHECKPCLRLLKENNGYKEDIKGLCGEDKTLQTMIEDHCPPDVPEDSPPQDESTSSSTDSSTGSSTDSSTDSSTSSSTDSSTDSSPSPNPCSTNWFMKLFDKDDCIQTSPSPSPSPDKEVTVTEIIIWIILSMLSVICGYLIYNAGGNIPIYVAINLGATLIYVILRFEI